MKIFRETEVSLILAFLLKIRGFMILLIKRVIGKMKDEVKGKIIDEFVGLRSKMYSLVMVDDKEIKKAMGVNRNLADSIRHKEYVVTLFGKGLIKHDMKRIQRKLQRIGTYDVCKIYLSWFDNKLYILNDGISS